MMLDELLIRTERFLSAQAVLKAVPQKQLRLETQLARKLDTLYAKAMRTILTAVETKGVGGAAFDVGKLNQWTPQAADLVFAHSKVAREYGDNTVVNDLRKVGMRIQATPLSPTQRDFLFNRTFTASKTTLKRMTGDVYSALEPALYQGLTNAQAAKLIEGEFKNIRKTELQRIARTELHNAQGYGANETIRQSLDYKQWWTADDGDVRDLHIELHGEITRSDGVFSNGLKHPGDTGGDAEEIVNCRCRVIPFIMPAGKMAPPGMDTFLEGDLIVKPKEQKVKIVKPSKEPPPPLQPKLPTPQKYDAVDYIGKLPKDLSRQTAAAVDKYTEGGYDLIMKGIERGYSRSKLIEIARDEVAWTPRMAAGVVDEAAFHVKRLDELMINSKNLKGTVHRGMALSDDVFKQFETKTQVGNTMKIDSITSTSLDSDIAEGFMAPGRGEKAVLMHFKTKTGTAIDKLSIHPEESEVLLRKGTKFKVAEVEAMPRQLGKPSPGIEVWLNEI